MRTFTNVSEDDAVDYVTLNADTATAPELSRDEVLAIVQRNKIRDSSGKAPNEDGYRPTYLLARAVYQAWDLRAARAATWNDFSADGTTLNQSQIASQLTAQARVWRKRCSRGVQ